MAENKKYLDLAGLSHFWEGVKNYVDTADGLKVNKTTKVNGQTLENDVVLGGANIIVGGTGAHKDKDVTSAIDALDAAIKAAAASGVTSFGGQTGAIVVDTVGTAVGSVKFTMTGKTLSGTVTGFDALATTEALNVAKQELNNAIKLKANQSALDTAVGRIDTLETGKAAKTEAVGSLKVSSSVTGSGATITITPVSVGGSDLTSKIANATIPAAQDDKCGVVTLRTIKNLAATAATSAYKIKGSKKSLAEVLAVPSTVVGDVYNITAQFTLDSKPYPAGTNVVFIGHGESEGTDDPKQESQWDALGGTVDLSPYATTSALNDAKRELITNINGVDSEVKKLSSTVGEHTTDITNLKEADKTLGGRIDTLEDWKGTATGQISTLETNVTELQNADTKLGERIAVLEKWKDTPLTSTEIDTIFNPAG